MTMIEIIKTTFAMIAIPVGSILAGVSTDDLLSSETHITLGEALAVGGVVVMAAFYIGKKFSQQSAMHRANQVRFTKIEKAMDMLLKNAGIDFSISETTVEEDDEP